MRTQFLAMIIGLQVNAANGETSVLGAQRCDTPRTALGIFHSGSGTLRDPYLVCNASDFGNLPTAPEAHFIQGQDIDLGEGVPPEVPTRAGRAFPLTAPFRGVYDGGHHQILNYRQAKGGPFDAAVYGLFDVVEGAHISNLTVFADLPRITDQVAAFSGVAIDSTFTNVHAIVRSEGVNASAGIVGRAERVLIDTCSVRGSMELYRFSDAVGGVIGSARGVDIRRCYVNIDFLARNHDALGTASSGGIVGAASSFGTGEDRIRSVIRNVMFEGTLRFEADPGVASGDIDQFGGIAGFARYTTFSRTLVRLQVLNGQEYIGNDPAARRKGPIVGDFAEAVFRDAYWVTDGLGFPLMRLEADEPGVGLTEADFRNASTWATILPPSTWATDDAFLPRPRSRW